jgi:WD40 repeat protein
MRTCTLLAIGIMILGLVGLSSCQGVTPEAVIASPTNLASAVAAPATPTPTEPVPTEIPTSVPSLSPTATSMVLDALPEASLPPFNPHMLNGTDALSGIPINADNAGQVSNLGRWGEGMIYEIDSSPDGSLLAVRTSLGVGLYDTQTMEEIHFLEIVREYGNAYMDPGVYNLVEFSPRGQLLAVVVGSQVHLLDLNDGMQLAVLEGEGENYLLMSIAFSEDGELLAGSEGWSADMNIWQVEDGKLLQTWQETPTLNLTISPDGQLLVSSNGEVHRTSDGALLYRIGEPDYGVNQVVFSANGEFLAANDGMEGKVTVWRAADGEVLQTSDWYASAVFSPDGQMFTLVNSSGEVQTFSLNDGSLVSSVQIDNPEFTSERLLAFSPDRSRLVTSPSSGIVNVWDLSSGRLIYVLNGHFDTVSQVRFSNDGQTMITADGDWVRTWLVADGTPLQSLRLGYTPPFVSPDGSTLVTEPYGYNRYMQVWNAADGSLRFMLEETHWPVSFSADSSMFAVSTRSASANGWISDTITIYNSSDGSVLVQLKDGDTELDNQVYDLSFSPDGSYLAAVRNYNDLAVWKMPEGELLYELSGQDYIPFVNLAFSPDGKLLATGNDYHKVLVFRAADGERLVEMPMEATEVMGESGQVSSLAFSPDGKLLAATDEGGFYQTWLVEDWSTLQHNSDFINQMWRPGVAIAFSPDGSILAIGGTGDAISLWSTADGTLLNTLTGHADDIVRVGFSTDASWLYSASLDGTVRFWGIASED